MTTPERTTEPAADVCPKCGANKTDPTTFDGYYDCSSFQFPAAWENKFTQSDTCRIRELESQVAKLTTQCDFFTKNYHCRECGIDWSSELHSAICSPDGDSYSDHPTRHDWYSKREGEMCDKMLSAQAEVKRLQAFKDWVHNWLDKHGVPHDPNPEHNIKTNCRIGGRLEWLWNQLSSLRAENERLRRVFDAAVAVSAQPNYQPEMMPYLQRMDIALNAVDDVEREEKRPAPTIDVDNMTVPGWHE